MAHNIHIPWTLLSTNLKYTPTSRRHSGTTDLFPRNSPTQRADLNRFTTAFVNVITSFATTTRPSHPSPIPPPTPTTIILTPSTLTKISPTISHYRTTNPSFIARPTCRPSCTHPWPSSPKNGCRCPVSTHEMTMAYWMEELDCTRTTCSPDRYTCCCSSGPHSDTTSLLLTLLLHEEVEAVLRVVAGEGMRGKVKGRWDAGGAGRHAEGEHGISECMRAVLASYIFLNVVYLHPHLWDSTSRRKWVEEKNRGGVKMSEEEVDYRKLVSWEKMVSRCTGRRTFDVHTYPHRLFYGVGEESYDGERWMWDGAGKCYLKPVQPGIPNPAGANEYKANANDWELVLWYLRRKGCPVEIGVQIMKVAGYKVERRGEGVVGDVLCKENEGELTKYLRWCWRVLVGCEVVMRECGGEIEWESEVRDVVTSLWGAKGMYRGMDWEEDQEENEKGRLSVRWRRVVFI